MRLTRRRKNLYLGRCDSSFADAIDFQLYVADFQLRDQLAQTLFWPARIDQRAQKHVAADASRAVEISDAHYRATSTPDAWAHSLAAARIRVSKRCAAVAAPSPLSMFTTVKPVVQLFSMPSNAATPWKLAP